MSWHGYKEGNDYARDDVVAKLEEHIKSGKVENFKQKSLYVQQINNCGHSTIRYSPQSEGGWGNSPMNPRNWQTLDGDPICETKHVPNQGKR